MSFDTTVLEVHQPDHESFAIEEAKELGAYKISNELQRKVDSYYLALALDIEDEPLMDVVEKVLQNGIARIGDLRGRTLASVFHNTDASVSQQQLLSKAIQPYGIRLT